MTTYDNLMSDVCSFQNYAGTLQVRAQGALVSSSYFRVRCCVLVRNHILRSKRELFQALVQEFGGYLKCQEMGPYSWQYAEILYGHLQADVQIVLGVAMCKAGVRFRAY